MRTVALIRISALVLVMIAPVAALLILGAVEPYGQRSHPAFPTIARLIAGKVGAFDELTNAILSRSLVRRAAIEARNTFSYGVVHRVDTATILSGRDDWLFYKQDFWGGVCLDPQDVMRVLAGVDVLTDLAEAAGIRFFVAMAPDKAAIYPEMLEPAFQRYWNCKQESDRLLSRLLRFEAPRVIDHREALWAAKSTGTGAKLFFHTDTHWSHYGAALGLRQLLSTVFPGTHVAPPRLTGGIETRATDMANKMLLLDVQEPEGQLDQGIEASLAAVAEHDPLPDTLIVHDSFYLMLAGRLKEIFPSATFLALTGDPSQYGRGIREADRVIVEVVERGFLSYFGKGSLGREGQFAAALINRNETTAAACKDFAPAIAAPFVVARDSAASGDGPAPAAAAVVVALPLAPLRRAPCIRIRATGASPGPVEIFLPRRVPADHAVLFEAGRSFLVTLGTDHPSAEIVLPDYVRGQTLAIGGGGAKGIEVSVGSLPAVAEP